MHHRFWVWIILACANNNAFEAQVQRKRDSYLKCTYGNGEQPLLDGGPYSNDQDDAGPAVKRSPRTTCLLLKLSYDGRRFIGGWDFISQGRSVKGVLQKNLAKIYGNIEPTRMIVESSVHSLNPGVHAVGLVVKVYGLLEDEKTKVKEEGGKEDSIVLPLPKSPNDICFALNRLCDDVQIKAYHATTTDSLQPSVRSVTFLYRLSIGPRPDPIHRHRVWHILGDPSLTILNKMQKECKRLVGAAANDLLDSMVVSRHEMDWNGTWRYDVIITGRMTDRLILSHVATVVVAGYPDLTGISVAPVHGLALADVHYDTDLVWHCANRYVNVTLFIPRIMGLPTILANNDGSWFMKCQSTIQYRMKHR